MSEDPEQVLPQQRVGTLRDVEEVCVEPSIEHEQNLRRRKNWDREEQQELRDECHPGEDRHSHKRHARSSHVEHRHDEVHRTGKRCDTGDDEAEVPEVDAVRWREDDAAVRGVHEPTAVGAATHDPTGVEEQSTKQERPETERIDSGERNVASADLQRDEVVRKRSTNRHNDEEDHRRAVHCVHLVVKVGAEK